MSAPARIAVAGAGQIGRRHAEAVRAAQGVSLACIADPAAGAADASGFTAAKHSTAMARARRTSGNGKGGIGVFGRNSRDLAILGTH